ncbi:MAG: hypothetical protein M1830_003917 [Pleopsidium flavum]|nr:MAG: hypothetical protein M1830_003917 [Pleopsidium flavum]
MSFPATEIAILPLLPGSQIEDPSSNAGKVWTDTINTVSQQDGFQRAYWGRRIENPSEVQLLIDWDSVDAHKKFMATPEYEPFGKHIGSILDGAVSIHHAILKPQSSSTVASRFSAPVTEIVTFYFPSSTSASDKSDIEDAVSKFSKAPQQHAEGFRGLSGGWIVEKVEHASVGEGWGFVGVAGWDSLDAHMAFRETKEFKEAIMDLRNRAKGTAMYHVKLQEK